MSKWILGLCLISLFAFSACGPSEEVQALRAEVRTLQQNIKILEQRVNLAAKGEAPWDPMDRPRYYSCEQQVQTNGPGWIKSWEIRSRTQQEVDARPFYQACLSIVHSNP